MPTPWARFRRSTLALRPWQRHSLVLTVAGFVYVCLGIIFLVVPFTPDRANAIRLALRLTDGSTTPWGIAWIIVGLLALSSTRWPPASKTWGYTALGALAALWGSVYALSVLFLHAPHAGLSGAFVWFLVAFLWWAISGLTNPDDRSPER